MPAGAWPASQAASHGGAGGRASAREQRRARKLFTTVWQHAVLRNTTQNHAPPHQCPIRVCPPPPPAKMWFWPRMPQVQLHGAGSTADAALHAPAQDPEALCSHALRPTQARHAFRRAWQGAQYGSLSVAVWLFCRPLPPRPSGGRASPLLMKTRYTRRPRGCCARGHSGAALPAHHAWHAVPHMLFARGMSACQLQLA